MTLDKPKHAEGVENEEHKSGFLGKVKGFIHDVGEKIEEKVGFGKPTADVKAIHIVSIDLKRAELRVEVLITNPNPIPIPLVDINYLIESDGRKLSTYNDINPGSIIPYKVRVELIVDVPVIGRITLPMEKTGEIPVPYKPEVELAKIRFGKFAFDETSATLHIKLDNKNDFDLGLNILEYEVWIGGTNIGGARQGIVEVPILFRPKDFGSAMWEMIRGRGTGYSIKGNIDVDTIFGPMKLPLKNKD
ncbi:hypothetical protein MKW92_022706 [Papaver armeniacum]|nr:hypothetical protein MKW92_022706 [Papaver armeniacum]